MVLPLSPELLIIFVVSTLAANSLLVNGLILGFVFVVGAYYDFRTRLVPHFLWILPKIVGFPLIILFYASYTISHNIWATAVLMGVSFLLGSLVILAGVMKFIGGADARALFFLFVLLPFNPVTSVNDYFPFAVVYLSTFFYVLYTIGNILYTKVTDRGIGMIELLLTKTRAPFFVALAGAYVFLLVLSVVR